MEQLETKRFKKLLITRIRLIASSRGSFLPLRELPSTSSSWKSKRDTMSLWAREASSFLEERSRELPLPELCSSRLLSCALMRPHQLSILRLRDRSKKLSTRSPKVQPPSLLLTGYPLLEIAILLLFSSMESSSNKALMMNFLRSQRATTRGCGRSRVNNKREWRERQRRSYRLRKNTKKLLMQEKGSNKLDQVYKRGKIIHI